MTEPFRSAPRRANRRSRRLVEKGFPPTSPVRRNPPQRPPGASRGTIAAVVVVAGLAIVVAAVLLFGNGSGGAGASPSPEGSGGTARGDGCPTSQPAALPAGQTRTVTITTPMGAIVIQVKADLSPIAVGNFVALATCGFYDGLVFHRVVPDFVIQGGDPNGDGTGGPGYEIKDEPVTAQYGRGTVAMARSSQPNSQGSQFFIVVSDDARSSLATANTYAILGTVTAGMDVVDQIVQAADQENPTNPVPMTTVTVANP